MHASIQKKVLEIPRRLVDQRLDVAVHALVQEQYPESPLSRGALSRHIQAGDVRLNGRVVSPDYRVKLHDKVAILENISITPRPRLTSRHDIHIPILYEDKLLLVIDKPAGIQMHPAGNQERDTVAHFILTVYPGLAGIGDDPLRPGIVHRLDRETSGVLVVAKTQAVFDELKKLFQERSIEKTYVALVYGHMPAFDGMIDKPLMQRSGALKRFVVETQHIPASARQALTFYRVIARYHDFDLLLVQPKTGRTHQIRAHMASLGHPIVGDKLYAWKPMRQGKLFFPRRQMLHALGLTFEMFSQKYAFEGPLPKDFQVILQTVDETRQAGYDGEALKNLVAGQ